MGTPHKNYFHIEKKSKIRVFIFLTFSTFLNFFRSYHYYCWSGAIMLKLKTKRKKSENREKKRVNVVRKTALTVWERTFVFAHAPPPSLPSAHTKTTKKTAFWIIFEEQKSSSGLLLLWLAKWGEQLHIDKKKGRASKEGKILRFNVLCLWWWAIGFVHACNKWHFAQEQRQSARPQREKKVALERKSYSQMVCVWFCDPQKQNCFFYIAAAVWCLQKLVTCLSMTSKSSKKKKRVSFLCHCVG